MILLVDDDPVQAHLAISILSGLFGQMHRAIDAAEALCLVEQPQFAADLRLVISGHHANGFGGPAFVAEFRERMPATPVLILGMKGESAADYAGEQVAFLPYPVLAQQLLTLTRKMLLIAKSEVA